MFMTVGGAATASTAAVIPDYFITLWLYFATFNYLYIFTAL